jgi:2-polyprenyl-3-methyl-5-hydroxy-6-metoxy-1,4-benzoquinol methylase
MKKNAYDEMFAVEEAHWWYVTLHDLVTRISKRQFPRQGIKILDAGCGTGGLLSALSGTGHDVAGFDYSDEALAFCRRRGLERVFKADLNNWSPSPNSYDLITSMDVLSHEWVEDEIKVLRALAGGLKEGGLIMVNYPAFPFLRRHHDKVVMIRERYTKKSLKSHLKQAGLVPVLLSYRLPHAFLYLIFLRLYESHRETVEVKSDIADIPAEFINRLLIQIGKVENHLIARGLSIPIGSSIFVVAKKAS